MSNRTERRELEAAILREYKTLQELHAYNHTSHDSDSLYWSGATWQVWCRYMGLREAAKIIGMGEFDYGRCERIINGTQYGKESYA